jgi:hypothetical protein
MAMHPIINLRRFYGILITDRASKTSIGLAEVSIQEAGFLYASAQQKSQPSYFKKMLNFASNS